MTWCTYILVTEDGTKSYVGSTNNFIRRFRQHSNYISGGAKYTSNLVKAGHKWVPLLIVEGFENQTEALQFELVQKQKMSKYRNRSLSLENKETVKNLGKCRDRLRVLLQCLLIDKWTCNSPRNLERNLNIYWYNKTTIPTNWTDLCPEHLKTICAKEWYHKEILS